MEGQIYTVSEVNGFIKNVIDGIPQLSGMRAGIKGGKTVEIRCDGDDENEAIQTLTDLFRDRFGEDE